MSGRPLRAALLLFAGAALVAPACRSLGGAQSNSPPARATSRQSGASNAAPDTAGARDAPASAVSTIVSQTDALAADLDRLFDDPALARAIVAVRVEALDDGRVLYSRNADTLVVPASNLKIVTAAVAAERLGWDFRYETRLEAVGDVHDGALDGDLVVRGGGDPSIGSSDAGPAALFDEWADALRRAGIHRIDGRIIGDDRAFDREGPGAGWAWDDLVNGYAAPASALSYNENVSVVHVAPADRASEPAAVTLTPPGSPLAIDNRVTTADRGTPASIEISRAPDRTALVVSGRIGVDSAPAIRTAAVPDPTRYFVEALRLALIRDGISVHGGAVTVADLPAASVRSAANGRIIATHASAPLSSIIGYTMKVSQNFYAEMLLRTLGAAADHAGSVETGRAATRETLAAWGIPPDAVVIDDGSGLSRMNLITTGAIVQVLAHVWRDERLRGPFVAALPVGAHDGTLAARMHGSPLDRRVEAKTGTLTGVRALSGYLHANDGRVLAFSIIVNNVTAPAGEVDAIVERALTRLLDADRAP